ncbi:peptidoglycan-binding protein [Kitasatospora sp. NBC_01287]|uniref:peptidoglycan-binding protein n=1 Tax=Kitasatospora sp. NBC_01287 TaxID=2903573 RepID=UPI0022513FC2|nr:peptidoglycan-binding protein [Kitasatospora sp. NBC_01287]MCX4751354.1 peptidoglycan-binding protein [Kitasatospora sp. NBC_01287]
MATHREQVEALSRTIGSAYGMWGAGDLKDAVGQALKLDPPKGSPDALHALGTAYSSASTTVGGVQGAVSGLSKGLLPSAWTGRAGEKATEVIGAAGDDLDRIEAAFSQAGSAFTKLGDALAGAQALHAKGPGPLQQAHRLLDDITMGDLPDPLNWDDGKMHQAEAAAKEGIGHLLDAAEQAESAGHTLTETLNKLSGQAVAGRIKGGDLQAADKLVLADAATPDGPADVNGILSANDATRAGQFMDRMNPQDRASFDALLANARSPQERAYLLKTLAAGHGVAEITSFDLLIHAHGDDPEWLAQRLTPVQLASDDTTTGQDGNQEPDSYQGVSWTQGPHPTCVASSTVMARAMLDPMYTLQLTTGGHPGDPQFDSGPAFAKRLQDEQNRVYDDGRPFYADWPLVGYDGIDDPGSNKEANKEIAPATGAAYHDVALNSDDNRRDALSSVEGSVDQGRPVPVSIDGGGGGHQMMIIGHSGDKLEIYNPWGYTTWVSEDDFVHGHMNVALSGQDPQMRNVTSVRLPQ